jgi:para-nitrobenzyl esterase
MDRRLFEKSVRVFVATMAAEKTTGAGRLAIEGNKAGMSIVEITSGRLSGVRQDSVDVYLGIPYAAPPNQARRFQSPKQAPSWTGVRPAIEFGAAAPQMITRGTKWIYTQPPSMSEDCLTLNVWAPSDAAKLPVVLWIHGGRFSTGATSMALFDGKRFAEAANVVLVTINHRNGPFGWLAHPDFEDPDTGLTANWGLQDQVQALKWVQQNIVAFGGDPGRVTVMGQSGGAINAIMIAQNPENRHLVHRLILLSPPYIASPGFADRADAAAITEDLARALGTSVAGLRNIAAEDLQRAEISQSLSGRVQAKTGRFMRGPVVDGASLLDWPSALELPPFPILLGYTRNEGAFFTDLDVPDLDEADGTGNPVPPAANATGRQASLGFLTLLYEAPADRLAGIVDAYFDAYEGDSAMAPSGAFAELLGDALLRRYGVEAAERAAKGGGSRLYMFDYALPLLSPGRSSPHCCELPVVFGTYELPYYRDKVGHGDLQQALSRQLMKSFGAFADCGNPSAGDLSEWPLFDAEARKTLILGANGVALAVGPLPKAEILSCFKDLGPQPKTRSTTSPPIKLG